MPRKPAFLLGATLVLAGVGFSVAIGKEELPAVKKTTETPVKKVDTKAPPTADKPTAKTEVKPALPAPIKPTVPAAADDKPSPDEEAIRATGDTFVTAYNSADAKAIAAHFTPDAEYIDEQGQVFTGRAAIQEAMSLCLAAHPGVEMEMNIYSIRFVTPTVAVEDGTTGITADDEDAETFYTRYTAVHVKVDGKWLTASVRELAPKDRRQHRSQLNQLAWLKGEWVDEGEETLVIFSCDAVDGGNFLIRRFTIHIAGQESMSGTQRIGWDPLTGKLKSWTFDSEGGYSEGFWHRDGDRWILKSTGVTADGQAASDTTIYTLDNEFTMTWQSIDHEVAGIEIPDSEEVTIVRRAPSPADTEETAAKTSN